MFNLSICLIIKDEGEYVNEWLEWHVGIGVEHFYIYDNGSNPPILNFIGEKYRSLCTIVEAADMTQTDAYDDCISKFGHENEWIAFIDTDEFIRVIDGRTIQEFLLEFPRDVDAVALRWNVYGADGQREKRDAPVRERFLHTVDTYPRNLPQSKCIIRPARITNMCAHYPVTMKNQHFLVVNERGEEIFGATSPKITNDIVVVDHYFTRSLEEWEEKINRGSCDPLSERKFDMFYIINPDIREE